MMARGVALILGTVVAAAPVPAFAAARDFILVNGTVSGMQSLSIRRYRTGPWQSLAVSPAPGRRSAVSFTDEECAFDIRATLAGKDVVTWSGVNLCEAKAVILNRDKSGAVWVDYD